MAKVKCLPAGWPLSSAERTEIHGKPMPKMWMGKKKNK